MPLKIIPTNTHIDFMKLRLISFCFSIFLVIASIVLILGKGLNFGIDFTGGILIEAKFEQVQDLAELRNLLTNKKIGDVSLQNLGGQNTILIRVGSKEITQEERLSTIEIIKQALQEKYGNSIEYRKTEYVGPKVGSELIKAGTFSLIFAIIGIMIYTWLRFKWQFGVGAIIALFHDAIITLGFFTLINLEFNLSSIAALLTVIGYSINDSVVIFDRIRENIRKFKKAPLPEIINKSVNETLSRTIMTALTTAAALIALIILGGEVVTGFSLAILFGIIIGTYSSVYIAAPILLYFDLRETEK